ncbi:leptin receptor isoform X4 [Hippocampus zosterae]|uniref:leptin receptor isoform X4 n=1 Tax=Hippocampus zosterae TaxID=109293 RepID=UPI00223DBE68|nr:leptin receptor isoform X4 [Hippocampus zosterae]
MAQSAMLSVLILVFLILTGTLYLKAEERAGLLSGVLDLPWQDQVCYDSTSAQGGEGSSTPTPERIRSESMLSQHPDCYLRSISTGSSLYKASGGTCLNILCRIDENWKTLTCDLGVPRLPSARLNSAVVAFSLQRLMFHKNYPLVDDTSMESHESVVCETKDSSRCSISIGTTSFVSILSVNISGCEARPILLNVPARPVKPRTPLNLSHFQTIKPELILQWDEPKDDGSGPLRYEVRYSNDTHSSWQVVSTGLERRLSLDLEPEVNYTMQVHCSDLHDPPLWSNWSEPYHIYLGRASIDIKCETSGDIDAMDCSWNNTWWIKPKFQYTWTDLPCDVMEEREKKGEKVGELGPDCLPVRSKQQACTIQDIRRNCYKLWLEMLSHQGPFRSKHIYISPLDHVKPHKPSNVKAVNLQSGVLRITWEPPPLPVQGLQCQFRYHSPSAIKAQPEWKLSNPVWVPSAEVPVPEMCQVYAVQVSCKPANRTGYWSDWSDPVYSVPQNSQAPEHGPDFWRILEDDQLTNSTNVTLLITSLPKTSRSYCISGYIVQQQTSSGIVKRKSIELLSSYSFEWKRELQSVTVEAYNSLGSSRKNMNMVLDRRPKRRSVHSFRVLLINGTCVSLHWSLMDNSSTPLFMVVQWAPQRQDGFDLSKAHSGRTWARLPSTDCSVHLTGDFYASEEYGFYLYPVFSEGEGEPAFTIASRGGPSAYTTLLIIALLSIVLFITLVLSQNQMKRFVWKDVPNPQKCSWAKGLNFKKADTFHELFQSSDILPAWPLLLPSENISKVVIMEKANMSVLSGALVRSPLITPTLNAVSCPFIEVDQNVIPPSSVLDLDILTNPRPQLDELQLIDPPQSVLENSAQSSVTYAAVLLTNAKQELQSIHLSDRDGSGSSSSDEGNFSADNSDISGSFPGGLWELDSCHDRGMDDPRRSCSYNSVEELSEPSDQEDATEEKDLYYLSMDYQAESEEGEGEVKQKEELLKSVTLSRDGCSGESHLTPTELVSTSTCDLAPLYMPQFRTAPYSRQLPD